MAKAFAAAILSLLAVGCSSTCKDGSRGFFFWARDYKACGAECHPEDPSQEKKECRCSTSCPCWKKHS